MTTLEDYIKLADGATEGPWDFSNGKDNGFSFVIEKNDGAFIASSRTLGPAMAKALIEAEGALRRLINAVEEDQSPSNYQRQPGDGTPIGDAKQSLATIERLRNGGV